MIMKIIIFALTIAFTVTFVVELLSGDLKNSIMVIEVLKIPGNVISGSLSAFGSLTIVFIILTKFNTDEKINLDEDWKPSELKDIQVGPEEESKVGSAFAIFFILIFVSVINSSPHLVNVAERAFESSGLELGHYIHLETFKYFLIPLTIIWLGELVYHTINIFTGSSRALAFYNFLLEIGGFIIMLTMVNSSNLYVGYESLLGFRGLFLVVTVIAGIECISKLVKFIKYYVLEA